MLTADVTVVAAALLGPFPTLSLQAFDPTTVTDASPTFRAAASFFLTVLFGGAVIYRDGGRIEAAVESSRRRPLVAALYGLMAFGVVTFFVAYALSQLANLGVGATAVGVIGVVVLGIALLTLGGLGFAVVGVWVTEVFGGRDPWIGLVGVGAVSAIAWLVLPVVVSLVVWLAIAAVGIGGPAREWVHGSAQPAQSA
ncbi:hypothetical protein [Haloarcula sp. JP-L23]|uniref:hypothetical protein n=1 Tax=Haloarcula sp. JP-L23 TaxID=2716717 RepID=UPI00140EE429|nr:hypothetical protein G9465_20145 [Haloarcula sp. JP-L23]